MPICKICKKDKDASFFYKQSPKASKNRNLLELSCKSCRLEKMSWAHLRLRYNLSKEDFIKKLKKQGNKCEICRVDLFDYRLTAVDHCHKTGKVRGILCRVCNAGIGCLNDSIRTLNKAIKYLERYK